MFLKVSIHVARCQFSKESDINVNIDNISNNSSSNNISNINNVQKREEKKLRK